jgi:hypothetical protein
MFHTVLQICGFLFFFWFVNLISWTPSTFDKQKNYYETFVFQQKSQREEERRKALERKREEDRQRELQQRKLEDETSKKNLESEETTKPDREPDRESSSRDPDQDSDRESDGESSNRDSSSLKPGSESPRSLQSNSNANNQQSVTNLLQEKGRENERKRESALNVKTLKCENTEIYS